MMVQLPLFLGKPHPIQPSSRSVNVGNTVLVEHGIFQDNSQWRIHVGEKNAYVYSTSLMKERCRKSDYRIKSAYQGKFETARGYIVPIKTVSDLQTVVIPELMISAFEWPPPQTSSLGNRGKQAEALVRAMLEQDLIQLPRDVIVEDCLAQQFGGVDLVHSSERVSCQVKCDLGIEKYGNLYIQTHECNPYKEH